ncbi:MAG: carboxypeptidase regulatory-like domain-containing protein [Candidatus Nealsonbacteria bacterium]|nr:carboxypeptidase regulatory-like domain-containing protein [Candidatus Nealsonbacteria bacterium]
MKKGLTLIEVLIGIFLLLIISSGVFGSYRLILKVIAQSRSRITATAIANGQIEKIKNLSYESIGINGGFPEGTLEAFATTNQNNAQYTIEQRVDYVIDPIDGVSPPEDDCPNDYKRAEVKVSWSLKPGDKVALITDIAPKNLTQECLISGGIISVSVFDAYGTMVPFPLIEIRDPANDQTLKTATPFEGQHYFSLSTSTYKIVVSKDGYSTERTYGTNEVLTPDKPNPIVLEGKLVENSFSIDKVSTFSVETLSPRGIDYFSDSFLNEDKISEKSNVFINDGKIELATSDDGYLSDGFVVSAEILPTNLVHWDKFYFSDLKPTDTSLKYQIYYASGTDGYFLIPESDLAGNAAGFEASPIDLSGLSIVDYDKLKTKAGFFSGSLDKTPVLYDWQTSWITSQAVSMPNIEFNLQGAKIIGKDSEENFVYKYSTTIITNSVGLKDIQNLEWDLYTFSTTPASNLDLVEIQPSPQPINLLPDTNSPVKLYLEAQNSFLLTLEDSETLEPIFSATATLSNLGLGYSQYQYTNEKGQTYFIPLSQVNYTLEIFAVGYLNTSTVVFVSGDTNKIIKLEQE